MRSRNEGVSRRRFLGAGLGAASVLAAGCERRHPPPPSPAARPSVLPAPASSAPPPVLPAAELTWSFPQTPIGKMSVVVSVPERGPRERFPLLIALHGRGETLKGPERGARGWIDDYRLPKAMERLAHPPLTPADFESFVGAERLKALNAALAGTPYAGLVVACPYLPDLLSGEEPFTRAPPLTRFLVETLIPKLYAETPVFGTPQTTGIDGVSLGGRGAIAVGLARPEAFGSVGSLQAALDSENASEVAARAQRALATNPKLWLRLVTSSEDYYLPALRTIAGALRSANVRHDFVVTRGPHDYAWNRGPGAYEMLLFHDRVLRGREPV
jgi:iron(III)-salmochelin esterase